MSTIFEDKLPLAQEESFGLHLQHFSDVEGTCEAIIKYPKVVFFYLSQ
jgi:hypothetical protein